MTTSVQISTCHITAGRIENSLWAWPETFGSWQVGDIFGCQKLCELLRHGCESAKCSFRFEWSSLRMPRVDLCIITVSSDPVERRAPCNEGMASTDASSQIAAPRTPLGASFRTRCTPRWRHCAPVGSYAHLCA